MVKTNELTNAPICPIHGVAMQELKRLPELIIGRGVTAAVIKVRKELNSCIRFRCPIKNCPRVDAVAIEEPSLVEILADHPGLTREQLRRKAKLSDDRFHRLLKKEILDQRIRCERRGRHVEYFAN